MASILLNFMQEKSLVIGNCRDQSYDNASHMSGRHNGVQATVNAMQCNDDYGRRREPLCPHQLNKRMCIKLLTI